MEQEEHEHCFVIVFVAYTRNQDTLSLTRYDYPLGNGQKADMKSTYGKETIDGRLSYKAYSIKSNDVTIDFIMDSFIDNFYNSILNRNSIRILYHDEITSFQHNRDIIRDKSICLFADGTAHQFIVVFCAENSKIVLNNNVNFVEKITTAEGREECCVSIGINKIERFYACIKFNAIGYADSMQLETHIKNTYASIKSLDTYSIRIVYHGEIPK